VASKGPPQFTAQDVPVQERHPTGSVQVFEEVTRNTQRLPDLEALDVPVKLIWGDTDLNLDTGVAEDFRSHFKHASLLVLLGTD
jgi:hypothetical protein